MVSQGSYCARKVGFPVKSLSLPHHKSDKPPLRGYFRLGDNTPESCAFFEARTFDSIAGDTFVLFIVPDTVFQFLSALSGGTECNAVLFRPLCFCAIA
jgi:hypothetical protein